MKTSNIIIIAFATFVLGGVLLLFVDAKQHKKKNENNFIYKEFTLPAFSVVVAEKGSDLHVDQSDSRIIKVQYDKSKPTPSKLYEVSNDTLHIYSGLRMFVKCKDLSVLIGKKPYWVGVNNFTSDSLTLSMNGGALFFNTYGYTQKKVIPKIANMTLIASDSAYVEIKNVQFQHLFVKSNNAEMNLYCNAKNSVLKLENHTKLFCFDNFDKLSVEKDDASRITLNNQHFGRSY